MAIREKEAFKVDKEEESKTSSDNKETKYNPIEEEDILKEDLEEGKANVEAANRTKAE